jgi:hypothetical protein
MLLLSLVSNSGCNMSSDYSFLEGEWYLIAMDFEDQNIYPDNPSLQPRFKLSTPGCEQYEIINFRDKDSSITLPGFDCFNIDFSYSIRTDSMKIFLFTFSDSLSYSKLKTTEIYSGSYGIQTTNNNHFLE